MACIDQIKEIIDREKYAIINASVYNSEEIMIDSCDIWFDHDVTLFCMQSLYVHEGRIDEIGDTTTCNIYELEKTLLVFSQRGTLRLNVTD